MNEIDTTQTVVLAALLVGGVGLGINFHYRHEKLEKAWEEFQKHRKELYANLTDPERIDADFEKSARAREMRDAQRTTLPREGAGPPAKVYRPKMRGAKPGNWRIQRP